MDRKPQKTTGPGPGGPGGHGHGRGGFEKPKDVKGSFKFILSYLGGFKFQLVVIVFCLFVSALAGVAGTYLLKPMINNLTQFIGVENPDLSGFIGTLAIMACVYIFGSAASFLQNRLMLNISTGVLKRIRIDMFRHMQNLPIRYFDSRTHGEIMSRFTNDTDTLREMISMSIPQLISTTVSVVGVFVMMLILSWKLTILVLIMLASVLLIVKKVGGKSAGYFIRQQKAIGQVNGYIEEMIEGQKVVKVFNHEDQVKRDFDALNEELCNSACNAMTFGSILMPIMNNLSYVHYALTAAIGGWLAIRSGNPVAQLGTLAAFLQYTRSFSQPITQISQQITSILSALAGAERIRAMIGEKVEEDDGKVRLVNVERMGNVLVEVSHRTKLWAWKRPLDDGSTELIELKGDMKLKDVVFGYVPEKTILHGISLYAKPGQKIAFVGSTGAGKTTITNLINRFYDIDSGSITYDGIDIKDIRKDDLRRSFGMVLQDTHLFTGTVKDNIRYGRLDATDDEIVAAAKLANAHFFISHLPNGYDTMLTADGANLSQGQRQLIAIARAAVADPPVLILDEATSSIDTRTESLIERGMDKLMQNRTVFVIAHRLSTVRNSNAIMVLENGEIIERGDHDDLLGQHGKYYQLYTGMFELS